jgi:hypothetical protein
MARRTRQEMEQRENMIRELENEAKKPPLKEPVNHEKSLPVPRFAKEVAHRSKQTVYWWLRTGQIPKKLILNVNGHKEIDIAAYWQWVRALSEQ